jgi:FkbM family methyltransferase
MSKVLQKIREYYLKLGLRGVVPLLAALLFAKLPGRPILFKMRLPGIKHPVHLRFSTSDAWVLKEVLLDGEYDFLPQVSPKVIIDAGANIGLTAIFFANKFPDSIIYALEPEESNFKMLEMNASAYPQIRPLKTALWNANKQISLINSSGGHWGFVTRDGSSAPHERLGLVDAVTLDKLMDNLDVKCIDILKIDIEGAEKEVFESSSTWIAKVQIIMVELHDRYWPGCEKAFHEATKGFQPEIIRGQTVMRLQATSKTP